MSRPAPTHVAFLRAINVGARRLPMAALREAVDTATDLEVLGSWQATGNLVLSVDGLTSEAVEERVQEALRDRLDLEAPTVVRTVSDVRAVAAARPFTAVELVATEGRLQVLWCRETVAPEAVEEALAHATPDDPLRWSHGVLWWLPREGVSTSALSVRAVEGPVQPATMRTHRAVVGLVAAHLDEGP